jgi:mono/diheme cytochrome c family protein
MFSAGMIDFSFDRHKCKRKAVDMNILDSGRTNAIPLVEAFMKFMPFVVLVTLVLAAAIENKALQQPASEPRSKASPAPLISSIQGPALYRAYCASCHGTDAKGGGPMAGSLKVKPSDLTRIGERAGGVFPKMRMERIVIGEEQPATGHGSIAMPVWGPIFSQVDNDRDMGRVRIDNLTRYLMSIQQTK